ncbi:transcriptional regulator [bacterium]|nr:MAG: transcriptional regulator [bacterium]
MSSPHERRRTHHIATVAVLADPVRRSLYEFALSREPGDVSRDQAAEALGIRRGLAAFHLDKLVEAGLMRTEYRRPSGVGGPGAGRPTKFYRRSHEPIEVSLPQRRYDLMGRFLADAVTDGRAPGARRAQVAAQGYGRELGAIARGRGGARPSAGRLIAEALAVLAEHGFEPVRQGRHRIILRNCPFHALAVDYNDTVCEVNLAMHRGVVESLGAGSLRAEREPSPGRCCVAYRTVKVGSRGE